MDLINFRPAETYLLINGGKIERSKLLKLITIDLILSGALTFTKERKLPSPNSKAYVVYKLIKRGPKYSEYKVEDYQSYFLEMFSKKAYKLQVSQFGKSINEVIGSTKNYRREITKLPKFNKLVTSSWLNSFKLTVEGEKLSITLEAQLDKAEKTLKSKKSSENDKALALKSIGNNIILIDDYPLSELKNIFKKTKNISSGFDATEVDFYGTDISNILIDTFMYDVIIDGSDFGDSFENGIFDSSFDSSFDSMGCSSGDSSGSGCSSCSSGCSSCSS